MFNGDDGDDPPPPYERHPPRDPPPPPPPVYPRLTAPSFRLYDHPVFPVTTMDDPDLINLNAYREVEWTEFSKPPRRRMEQTHYVIIVGSHVGLTANLETARATQILVPDGWIEECLDFWRAVWMYRQKSRAGRISVRFRGNSQQNVAAFQQLAARCVVAPPHRAIYPPLVQPLPEPGSSSRASGDAPSSSRESSSTNSAAPQGPEPTLESPPSPFPTILVPTAELYEGAYLSAPPLLRGLFRKDSRITSAKRANSSKQHADSRPAKIQRMTEVVDLTVDDSDAEDEQEVRRGSVGTVSAPLSSARMRAISISDSDDSDAVELARRQDKGKGRAA